MQYWKAMNAAMEMGMHEIVITGGSGAGAVMAAHAEADTGLRRGPWSVEEDLVLVNYIAVHGEGRWNSLARSAGLKRSGKSCRLRWLNYLRPDVRRGNFTPEEQLLILELHSRWGNRWSKIAQHLPGRTDNEIKNYWRTRVQKHAKHLKCDVNSQKFRDAMRYLWMPRLMESIQANSTISAAEASGPAYSTGASDSTSTTVANTYVVPGLSDTTTVNYVEATHHTAAGVLGHVSLHPDHSSVAGSFSDSSTGGTCLSSPPLSNLTDCYVVQASSSSDQGEELATSQMASSGAGGWSEPPLSPFAFLGQGFPDLEQCGWAAAGGFSLENLWGVDDIWFLEQQLQLRDV